LVPLVGSERRRKWDGGVAFPWYIREAASRCPSSDHELTAWIQGNPSCPYNPRVIDTLTPSCSVFLHDRASCFVDDNCPISKWCSLINRNPLHVLMCTIILRDITNSYFLHPKMEWLVSCLTHVGTYFRYETCIFWPAWVSPRSWPMFGSSLARLAWDAPIEACHVIRLSHFGPLFPFHLKFDNFD
jgi:hypothetical protein